ncbi:hypothetical protein DICA1_C06238 [Diutina catenulata]
MEERGSRKSAFSKGIKRLGKSASIINFHQMAAGDDDAQFAALGYDTAPSSQKPTPIHKLTEDGVYHFYPKGDTPDSTHERPRPPGGRHGGARPISGASSASSVSQPPHVPPERSIYSQGKKINDSFSSLDPKSSVASLRIPEQLPAPTISDDDLHGYPGAAPPDLAQTGLDLAGYGLSAEDYMAGIAPPITGPPLRKTSSASNTSASSFGSRPATLGRTGSASGPVHSYTHVAVNINQMPEPEVVNQLFERLLSIRVFSDRAIKTLREQPVKRKWELLLREHETNSGFDLPSLRRQVVAKVSRQPSSLSSSSGEGFAGPSSQPPSQTTQANPPRKGLKKANSTYNLLSRIAGKKSMSKEEAAEKRKIREGTPEWFVAKIMNNKLSVKEFKKLEKRLVENPYSTKYHQSWVQGFSHAQGESALSVILSRINKKSIKSNEELEMEYIIVKCLKHIINAERLEIQESGDDAATGITNNKPHVIRSMMFSLISPRISTRKLVTEVMIFLSYYRDHEFLDGILEGLRNLQDLKGDRVRFAPWLQSLSTSLDQHFRSGDRYHQDSVFKDYTLTSLLLINSIIEGTHHLQRRVALRKEFSDAGIVAVFDKLKSLGDERIVEEIDKYEVYAEDDYNDFVGGGGSASSAASAVSAPSAAVSQASTVLDDRFKLVIRQTFQRTHGDFSGDDDDFLRAVFDSVAALTRAGWSEQALARQLALVDSAVYQITDRGCHTESVYQRMLADGPRALDPPQRFSMATQETASSTGDTSFAVSADFINELERMFSARSATRSLGVGRRPTIDKAIAEERELTVDGLEESEPEFKERAEYKERAEFKDPSSLDQPASPEFDDPFEFKESPAFENQPDTTGSREYGIHVLRDTMKHDSSKHDMKHDMKHDSMKEARDGLRAPHRVVDDPRVASVGSFHSSDSRFVDAVSSQENLSQTPSTEEPKKRRRRRGHINKPLPAPPAPPVPGFLSDRDSLSSVENVPESLEPPPAPHADWASSRRNSAESRSRQPSYFVDIDTSAASDEPGSAHPWSPPSVVASPESIQPPERSTRRDQPRLLPSALDDPGSAFAIDPDVQAKIQQRLAASKIKVFRRSPAVPETAFDRMRRERQEREAREAEAAAATEATPKQPQPALASPANIFADQSPLRTPEYAGEVGGGYRYSGLYEKFDQSPAKDAGPLGTSSPTGSPRGSPGLNQPIVFYEVSDDEPDAPPSARQYPSETRNRLSLMLDNMEDADSDDDDGKGSASQPILVSSGTSTGGSDPFVDVGSEADSSGLDSVADPRRDNKKRRRTRRMVHNPHDDSFQFVDVSPSSSPEPARAEPVKHSVAVGTSPPKQAGTQPPKSVAVGTSPPKQTVAVGTSPPKQLGTSQPKHVTIGTSSKHSMAVGTSPPKVTHSMAVGTSPPKQYSGAIRSPGKLPPPVRTEIALSPIKQADTSGTASPQTVDMSPISKAGRALDTSVGSSATSTETGSAATDATDATETVAGPPPPPPMPSFLEEKAGQAASQTSQTGAPPPPPPVPGFLGGSSAPPPPPVPTFLGGPGAIGRVPAVPTGAAPVANGPPPPPPVPTFLGAPPPPPVPNFLSAPMSRSPSGIPVPPPLPDTPNGSFAAGSTAATPGSDGTGSGKEATPVPDPLNTLAIRPKQKLKQMHWDKIEDIEKTFWTDIEHGKLSDRLLEKGILTEVEQVFVAKTSAMKKKRDVVKAAPAVVQRVSFLPRDLAQSFGINLHMFSAVSAPELAAMVLHCHRDVLSNVSVLEFFNSELLTDISDQMRRQFMPYSTDYGNGAKGLKKGPRQNPDELERADRLFLELPFNLAHYWKSRSRALLLTTTYARDYSDLVKKLALIDAANANLRESAALKNVLGIIRSVGNFMNDSAKQAMGFKLDTLQRLKFMKDDKNSSNFLHYIERIVRNEFPEYGSFVDDLSSLQFIQNVSIDQLDADCQDFERIINNVSMSMSKGNLSDPSTLHPDDRVLAAVTLPMEKARSKNAILQRHWNRTFDEFKSLMEYFGENPNDAGARKSFFMKFQVFVTDFKKAHGENVQKEEEQRVYEARKRAMEESLAQKKRRKEGVDEPEPEKAADDNDDDPEEDANTSRMSTNSDIIDTLLEKLKSSNPRPATAKDRRARNRRSKAMSFYASVPPVAESPDSEDAFASKLAALRQDDQDKEYDSVNQLKRRMTRRRTKDALPTASPVPATAEEEEPPEMPEGQTDQLYLRAQAMLNQLRT